MTRAARDCVRQVAAAEVLSLRHSVLRAGLPPDTARFAGDEEPESRHFGAYRGSQLVGVATLLVRAEPSRPGVPALQLRGMATLPEVRGEGFGAELAAACVAEAALRGVSLVWCNARLSAAGFYARQGFERDSETFEVAGIGPHVRMLRAAP